MVKVVSQARVRPADGRAARPSARPACSPSTLSREQLVPGDQNTSPHRRTGATTMTAATDTAESQPHRPARAARPPPALQGPAPSSSGSRRPTTRSSATSTSSPRSSSSCSAASWRCSSAPSSSPRAAGRRQPRAVQPALHHARHDHAAALRDAALRRLRQRDHAAADRLARRRVPAPQHVRLLALPLRRPHRRRPASSRRRARPRSAGSPTRRCPTPATAPASAATCGSSASRSPASARSSARSTSSRRSSACARPA